MRKLVLFAILWTILWVVNSHAEEVRVYCKNGTVIKGHIISASETTINIDPIGPMTLRKFSTSDIDSVISISGERRVIFPLNEHKTTVDIGKYRAPHRFSPFTKKFTLGIYGSYRFPHTLERTEIIDDYGQAITITSQVDGSTGYGAIISAMWPMGGGRQYGEIFIDLALFDESISFAFPGGRYVAESIGYLACDFGLKPMLPLINRRVKLFLSPMGGIGLRITNIRTESSYYGISYSAPFQRQTFDSCWALFFGGGIDLLSAGSVAASADVKVTYSELFLNVDPFLVPEIRVTISYMTDI